MINCQACGANFDIYFLDIEMDSVPGMELARHIREQEENSRKRSILIFVTGYREYMEEVFDVNAFHYLLKPLDKKKFAEVFDLVDSVFSVIYTRSFLKEKYVKRGMPVIWSGVYFLIQILVFIIGADRFPVGKADTNILLLFGYLFFINRKYVKKTIRYRHMRMFFCSYPALRRCVSRPL